VHSSDHGVRRDPAIRIDAGFALEASALVQCDPHDYRRRPAAFDFETAGQRLFASTDTCMLVAIERQAAAGRLRRRRFRLGFLEQSLASRGDAVDDLSSRAAQGVEQSIGFAQRLPRLRLIAGERVILLLAADHLGHPFRGVAAKRVHDRIVAILQPADAGLGLIIALSGRLQRVECKAMLFQREIAPRCLLVRGVQCVAGRDILARCDLEIRLYRVPSRDGLVSDLVLERFERGCGAGEFLLPPRMLALSLGQFCVEALLQSRQRLRASVLAFLAVSLSDFRLAVGLRRGGCNEQKTTQLS